ncbi:hypothetical protein [Streptomyces sp. NBC_00158]|uniref:hypothetical protein n=1 Tax=Streptomyces sp. NBC_00158 TaxID=2903627 RepID=UPI00386301BC
MDIQTIERHDWGTYFVGIAEAVAARGDCHRSQVGAVLVGPDRRIRSTGYNGVSAGMRPVPTQAARPQAPRIP